MRKIYLSSIILICLWFVPVISQSAENDLTIENSEVSGTIVYPLQWDIEVLDFSLIPFEDDVFNSLTMRSIGSAPYYYFEGMTLYEDDGDGIFEGWNQDIEVGEATYYDLNQVWYWSNMEVNVPKEGKRFFVTAETKRNANISVDRRTIQMEISAQYDANGNSIFDFSTDKGIFMASKNNGPESGILNSSAHTIYKKSVDSLVPKSVITYPFDGEEISETNITILGASRDQGGSTPSLVEINISKEGENSEDWNEVVATGSSYITWEFDWVNIEDGVYNIKTKSVDWIGNVGEEEAIMVIIDTEPEEPVEPTEPEVPVEPVEPDEPEIQKPAGVSDGDLVRAAGDYKVYVVQGNYRRWIQSASIFGFYGHFNFSVVKNVTKQELESYKESWLVRAEGDERVYEINGDRTKHWINITAEKFTASGRSWDMIYVINKSERDFYTIGADVLI